MSITGVIRGVRNLLAIAPEDYMQRQRHLPHEWAEWEGNYASCRWCGCRRERTNAHQRCKVLV
jgi:hypothetical protein